MKLCIHICNKIVHTFICWTGYLCPMRAHVIINPIMLCVNLSVQVSSLVNDLPGVVSFCQVVSEFAGALHGLSTGLGLI